MKVDFYEQDNITNEKYYKKFPGSNCIKNRSVFDLKRGRSPRSGGRKTAQANQLLIKKFLGGANTENTG